MEGFIINSVELNFEIDIEKICFDLINRYILWMISFDKFFKHIHF
jgi:hypothetical protein